MSETAYASQTTTADMVDYKLPRPVGFAREIPAKPIDPTGFEIVFLASPLGGASPMTDSKVSHNIDRRLDRYVDVVTVIKGVSLSVFGFCALCLVVFFCTGFVALNPALAILIGIASITFLIMSKFLERSYDERI